MSNQGTAARALLQKEFVEAGRACRDTSCQRYDAPFRLLENWWWHLTTNHPGSVRHYNISQRLFKLYNAGD